MNNILIWNEDRHSVDVLHTLLLSEGFQVVQATEQSGIGHMIETENIHLLLTDIEPGYGDGIQMIRDIRKSSSIPILVFSKNGEEAAKIAALNAGADDYVTMPCNPLELLARIKSQIRRYTQMANLCENTG